MIALLENEFVSRKKWLGKDEFVDMIAVAESTPGPIAVNMATFIGYNVAGVLGALLATLAVCLPAFTVIFVISLVFDKFLSFKYVGYAFRGIQIAVVYLIGSAGVKVFKGLKKTPFSIALCLLVFASFVTLSVLAISFSSVFYILICGVLGLMLYAINTHRAKGASSSPEEKKEGDGAKTQSEPSAAPDGKDPNWENHASPEERPRSEDAPERREEE